MTEKTKLYNSTKTIFDKKTLYAIKSIFLGAKVHDAAALCERNDQSMRNQFLLFCKDTNRTKFEEIAIQAVNDGWNSPPVKYFRDYINDFFSKDEITTYFMSEYFDDVGDVINYYASCIVEASNQLRIARVRHAAMTKAMNLNFN